MRCFKIEAPSTLKTSALNLRHNCGRTNWNITPKSIVPKSTCRGYFPSRTSLDTLVTKYELSLVVVFQAAMFLWRSGAANPGSRRVWEGGMYEPYLCTVSLCNHIFLS